MDIIILRHGESVADIEDRYEGRADFPLTDYGQMQAERAAKWIYDNCCPDYVMSSPLKRTAQTAEHLSKITGLKVNYDTDLMEMDNGLIAGMKASDADIKYPIPEGGFKPHEPRGMIGESIIDFRARAERFWSKFTHYILPDDSIKRICIVSHGGMINMLFKCYMELPVNDKIWIHTGDTGINFLKMNGDVRQIIFLNSLTHLDGLKKEKCL